MERPRFDAQREREFVTQGWWRDDTLPRWLARHARERPGSPAVGVPRGPAPEDPCLLFSTFGTTASPRGVPHPYRTVLSNARLSANEHRLTAADRILSPAPFSHLYGLYSLHCAWAVGACSVLLPAFRPDDLALLIERQKPTALWTAPAHVAACRAAGLFGRHDWSSLKLAIVSGSIAPAALIREFADAVPRCAVTQLWGMTELQAGLSTRARGPPEWLGASGRAPGPRRARRR